MVVSKTSKKLAKGEVTAWEADKVFVFCFVCCFHFVLCCKSRYVVRLASGQQVAVRSDAISEWLQWGSQLLVPLLRESFLLPLVWPPAAVPPLAVAPLHHIMKLRTKQKERKKDTE
jgi:hypothetical protein